PAQLEWLIEALKSSKATFKFVCTGSQILNPTTGYENFINFPEERDELLRLIEAEGIPGVIFLTGDRHFSEVSVIRLRNGQRVYDITASPLTASPFTDAPRREENPYRLEGTLTPQRNFLLLHLSGPEKARTLTITAYNSQGQKLWEKSLSAQDLQPK
ncbi:MAG: hypothetical protein D6750_09155, partial [Bacteroidetes bacterium]